MGDERQAPAAGSLECSYKHPLAPVQGWFEAEVWRPRLWADYMAETRLSCNLGVCACHQGTVPKVHIAWGCSIWVVKTVQIMIHTTDKIIFGV